MSPKELAAHYGAKTFETKEAAEAAGFVLTETHSPRNTWNKASAAQAIMHKLLKLRASGEAKELGLVLENYSVTGCYKKQESEVRSQNPE
jgi:cytolysin (calcineurin-like family phosphatase)